MKSTEDVENTHNVQNIAKLKDEFLIFLKKREVLATLLMSICSFASLFILITYMSVVLMKIAGFSKQELGYILSLLGVGMTLGSFGGGKFYKSKCEKLFCFFSNKKESHWSSNHFLISILFCMIGVEYLFSFLSYIKLFAVFGMFFFGFVTFVMVPFTQTRIIEKASDAPNLASTFNVASFNIGSGLGSLIAGTALGYGMGVEKMSLIAIAPTSLVILLAYYNVILDRKNQQNLKNFNEDKDESFEYEEKLTTDSS